MNYFDSYPLLFFPVTLQMLLSLEAEQSSTRGYQASVSCQQSCEIQMLCLPWSHAQTPCLVFSFQFLRVLNFKAFPCRERAWTASSKSTSLEGAWGGILLAARLA